MLLNIIIHVLGKEIIAMKHNKIKKIILPLTFCIAALFLSACATKPRMAVSQLDTPGHHTFTGLKLLEQKKYEDARREFTMASQLDPKYSKSYTGMALVNIYSNDFQDAAKNLDLGFKNAQSDDEKLFVNVARIRYYTLKKSDQKWLELAKNQFDQAVVINPSHSQAYYFMGLAYKEALQFDQANKMFFRVAQLKTDHLEDADTQLMFLDKVRLAMPATETGKKICLVESITRADAAALFMQELKIKNIYKKPEPKVAETEIYPKIIKQTENLLIEVNYPDDVVTKQKNREVAPAAIKKSENIPMLVRKSEEGKSNDIISKELREAEKVFAEIVLKEAPVKLSAKDIGDHPLKKDIEGILETEIRGLENDPNGNYNPNEVLSRGEFAIMLEDVLIKVTGEKDLAARYVNQKSLFPDVPLEMPYFNAITAVTAMGIMEAKNTKTGEFLPFKPVPGVDALLIIRKLQKQLKLN